MSLIEIDINNYRVCFKLLKLKIKDFYLNISHPLIFCYPSTSFFVQTEAAKSDHTIV